MNLYSKLQQRESENSPIRVCMIGAGKFGSMFLAQLPRLPGIHVAAIADLKPENAQSNLEYVGWEPDKYSAKSIDEAIKTGTTFVTDDWQSLIEKSPIDIVIECTGDPISSTEHCISSFKNGKNVINATVEADALCGPSLARQAKNAGVVYSMAYGDQPAIACELVDWARACGFKTVAAGRGHKWIPEYRFSTPDTVWNHWGLKKDQALRGRLNPKMFNSFLDGSKPAIESAAIANATGLSVPSSGLTFPPGSIEDIPNLMRPKSVGGLLGSVVISSLTENGDEIQNDIRQGVCITIEAGNHYVQNCFEEYKVETDNTGRFVCLFKKWHLIGLELGLSVASVGIRGEPTGCTTYFNADVIAIAKANLKPGCLLDGEGGYTVYGGLRPTKISMDNNYLPLGLANQATLLAPVKKDQPVRFDDVKLNTESCAYKLRQEIAESIKQKHNAP